MHKYMPSKKFTYILLSIIITIGIIYFFSWLRNRPVSTVKMSGVETKAKVQEFMALDTDGDGMKDWEEALWKTDPNKTDTDNDGTSDSDEIKLNRDPLKQNINPTNQEPSDKVDPKIIADNKKAEEEFTALSETDKMGRMMFSQYIATKKLDSELTATDKTQIVESTLANLPMATFKLFSKEEIITTDQSDNETLRVYINNIAFILIENLKIKTETVDDILTDFSNIINDADLKIETSKIFKRFSPLVEKNKKTVNDLLGLRVPKVILAEHLELLNAFQKTYQSLDIMQKSTNDIITLLPVINNYDAVSQNLADSLAIFSKKIADLKIKFSNENDYGYQFFNVIIFK